MPRSPLRSAPWLLLSLALLLFPIAAGGCGGDEDERSGTPYGAGYGEGYGTGYGAGGAAGTGAALDAGLRARAEASLEKARAWLLGHQEEDGSWGDPAIGVDANVGFTAMATAAVVRATPPTRIARDAAIAKALDVLAANQHEDGSIYDDPRYVNYTTSAAIGAFAAARLPAYRSVQVRARDYLASSQIAGDEEDLSYGGFPYKQDQGQPSDLSNVQFAATALADGGLPADHPVWERLRVYLARVQNRSESNALRVEREVDGETVVVVSGDDGGAAYYPGESKAGFVRRADGTYEARSYGSMTYALLKCLVLAGVDLEDPRVGAALGWIREHFVLDRNPGFEAAEDPATAGQQGYYYYLFTLARTLAEYERVSGEALAVRDAAGGEHAWRAELVTALLERQGEEGAWRNEVSRWEEASPVLCTSYAVQALADALGRR